MLSENVTKLAQQTELHLAVVLVLREHMKILRSVFRLIWQSACD